MDNKEKDLKGNYAIVIGDWHFNSLGLIRSLGENGIPVVYLNLSDGGYGESSRYTWKVYHVDGDIYNTLIKILDNYPGKPLLFPGCDKAAVEIDSKFESLKDRCVVPGLCGKVEKYMNKEIMCSLAQESGFLVPKSLTLKTDDSVYNNIISFGLPCIIKPLLSIEGSKADITICKTEDDVRKAVCLFKESGQEYRRILVQRYVDGNNSFMISYSGCKTIGKQAHVLGQLEKVREYPINRGSTSYAVIKDKYDYLNIEALNKFLNTIEYNGIFELEIKVVDGIPYFIEINFRNGAPSYAYTSAGFNIPLVWYYEVLGNVIMDLHIRETVLMCERDDLNHVKDKNIGIMKWIKDIHNTDVFMLFNKADPEPFIAAYGKRMFKLMSVLTKKTSK